jgi:F1F0 ATPase subunit 2
MNAPLLYALDFLAGLFIGAIFYGGLWWTVGRIHGKTAGLWLVSSFLVRSAIALAGFYAVTRASGYAAAACLAGFLVARVAVTYATRVPGAARPPITGRSALSGSRSEP